MICSTGRALRIVVLSAVIALLSVASSRAEPQSGPGSAALSLTAEQLDQLVAPIALYPDSLIAQILMAATYPLEVVEADRWLRNAANAALTGGALTAALQQLPWDPSVKSLVPFREVLHLMNANLDWTERLGDAFLAGQADVMDAVQRLRLRARAAGSLASTPQQTVSTEDQEVTIEPANPDVLYLPVYNPWCAYGAWPYPDYPPFYFGSSAGYCGPADDILAFGGGVYPAFAFWARGHLDWRHREIRVNHGRFQQFHAGHEPPAGTWQHDPMHRHGVPYRSPETAARFPGPAHSTPNVVRGFAPGPSIMAPERATVPSVGRRPGPIGPPSPPAGLAVPPRPLPPAYESFGRGAEVRGEAARGFSSRMAPPAPSFHAAPMPSFHAAPSFHGGGGSGGHR